MDKKHLLKKVTTGMILNPKRERARFNMTLGSFIKALQRERRGLYVITDTHQSIGIVHGYPRYQGDLAFSITTIPITVEELIAHCDQIMSRNIQGPEGTMVVNHGCPLWVCHTTSTKGQAISDVIADEGVIKIILHPSE